MDKVLRYFLGSSSPQGYVSRPDQLGEPGGWRCWVVQGGAAASRSAVIARARRAMEGRDALVEELVCSGDPSTLDGAIFPGCRVSIADGDPPHAIQPRHPGAYEEMVSLWGCLDRRVLWDAREEIIRLEREEERLERDAGGDLYAAGALTGELASMGAAATDRGKLLAYARRLAAREFPRPAGKKGGEKVRLLSAVTPEGQLLLRDTVAAAAPRAIAIEDSWGAVANALLEALRDLALESGLEVVTCRCPLFPFTKLDHLLLPQLGLGFLTLNRGNARELTGLTHPLLRRGPAAPAEGPGRLPPQGRRRDAGPGRGGAGTAAGGPPPAGPAAAVRHRPGCRGGCGQPCSQGDGGGVDQKREGKPPPAFAIPAAPAGNTASASSPAGTPGPGSSPVPGRSGSGSGSGSTAG